MFGGRNFEQIASLVSGAVDQMNEDALKVNLSPDDYASELALQLFPSRTLAQQNNSIYHLARKDNQFTLHLYTPNETQSSCDHLKIPVIFNPKLNFDYTYYTYDFKLFKTTALFLVKILPSNTNQPLITHIYYADIDDKKKPTQIDFRALLNEDNSKYLQVELHPFNPKYICALTSTPPTPSKFLVLHARPQESLIVQLALDSKKNFTAFSFAELHDQNQCAIYFTTKEAEIIKYDLLLENLSINDSTSSYLSKTYKLNEGNFRKSKQREIILKIDDPRTYFKSSCVITTDLPKTPVNTHCAIILKLPCFYNLIMQVLKKGNNCLILRFLIIKSPTQAVLVCERDISFDSEYKLPSASDFYHLKQHYQPFVAHQNTHLSPRFELPVIHKQYCLLGYLNCLIMVDYSNLRNENELSKSIFKIHVIDVSMVDNPNDRLLLEEQQICLYDCAIAEIDLIKSIIFVKFQGSELQYHYRSFAQVVAGELEGDDKTNVEIRITEEQNELQEQIQKLKDDLINRSNVIKEQIKDEEALKRETEAFMSNASAQLSKIGNEIRVQHQTLEKELQRDLQLKSIFEQCTAKNQQIQLNQKKIYEMLMALQEPSKMDKWKALTTLKELQEGRKKFNQLKRQFEQEHEADIRQGIDGNRRIEIQNALASVQRKLEQKRADLIGNRRHS